MDTHTGDIIFSLKGVNPRAREAVSHKYNRKAVSETQLYTKRRLNFGNFSVTKDPNPILTIATLGSSKSQADIYIGGRDISPVNCAFVINYKTGIVLIEDRSRGRTQVYDSNKTSNQMPKGDGPRRVAITNLHNTMLHLGKEGSIDNVKFEIVWGLNPGQVLWLVNKRISGASRDVRERCLIDFPGQTPFREPNEINHIPTLELGEGGYGKVHKTIDALSGDYIAVKTILPPEDFEEDKEWEERVKLAREREVHYLKRINHPNIIKLFGSQGWGTETVEMFFPLMEGSLLELMTGSVAELPEQQRMEIGHRALFQMLTALDYLASRLMVHRDVKPENILYDTDHQGRYRFVLADFGLANEIILIGSKVGTKIYAAPEVTNESEVPSSRMDIWSLFITMLWVYDVDNFRGRLRTKKGKSIKPVEVYRIATRAAAKNPKVAYIREMGVYDPNYRASAAQMLHKFGKKEIIRSRYRPLDEDDFEEWMIQVRTGGFDYSRDVMRWVDSEG
ncbi:kinase-like protein [Hypoxylon sp. NC0597]|nr:kinase-like protein [Hypoxylon sp. NC0597]